MHRYKTFNSPMVTTAAAAKVTSGTSIKTMLQLSTPSTRQIQLISWGFACDVNQNGTIDLIEADTAATVTAHVAAGVQPLVPGQPASLLTLGTSNTGYTSSSETAPVTTRSLDLREVDSSASTELNYTFQWMPDERPIIAVSKFVRIRATFGTATNVSCWIVWDE